MFFSASHISKIFSRSRYSDLWRLFLLVCLVPNSMAGAADTDAPAVLVLKPEAEVTGARILLGDLIAETTGPALGQLPKDLDIMAAPRPGTVKSIAGRKLAELVTSLSGLPKGALVSAPEIVKVRRASQTVGLESLKDLLTASLGPGDWEIRRITVRGNKDFPLGALAIRLAEYRPDKKMRRVDAVVEVLVDGRVTGKLNVSALVDRYAQVLCLERALEAGAVLQAAELTRKRVNISMLSNHVLFEMEAAVGKELKQGLRAGALLESKHLINPTVVQKGDQVKLIVKNGHLSITTTGVAKSSGGVSDQIRVENTASSRIVTGQVKDAATVEIVF